MKSKRAVSFSGMMPLSRSRPKGLRRRSTPKRRPNVTARSGRHAGKFEGQVVIVTDARAARAMEAKMIAQQGARCIWPTSKKRD